MVALVGSLNSLLLVSWNLAPSHFVDLILAILADWNLVPAVIDDYNLVTAILVDSNQAPAILDDWNLVRAIPADLNVLLAILVYPQLVRAILVDWSLVLAILDRWVEYVLPYAVYVNVGGPFAGAQLNASAWYFVWNLIWGFACQRYVHYAKTSELVCPPVNAFIFILCLTF